MGKMPNMEWEFTKLKYLGIHKIVQYDIIEETVDISNYNTVPI